MEMSPENTVFITSVHGTFAPFAAWASPDSDFTRELIAGIHESSRILDKPSPTVVVFRFVWSSLNGLRARRQAAQKLQKKLTENLKQFPFAQHFIIAHSHGGNIAMYALRDQKLASRISGIVCMATPFLQVRFRDPNSGIFAIHCAIIVSLAWMGISVWPDLPAMVKVGMAILLIPLTLNLFFTTWQRAACYWMREMELPVLRKDQVLILTVAGDEAAEGLKTARLAFDLLCRIFVIIGLADKFLRNKLGRAYFPRSRVYPLGIVIAVFLLTWPSQDAALVAIITVYLASFVATGGWSLPHLPLDIQAEQTIAGYASTALNPQTRRNEANPLSLQHSKIYDHPEAVRIITEWIRPPNRN